MLLDQLKISLVHIYVTGKWSDCANWPVRAIRYSRAHEPPELLTPKTELEQSWKHDIHVPNSGVLVSFLICHKIVAHFVQLYQWYDRIASENRQLKGGGRQHLICHKINNFLGDNQHQDIDDARGVLRWADVHVNLSTWIRAKAGRDSNF